MSGIAGKIVINKITHNTIFVTWRDFTFSYSSSSSSNMISPSFTLTIERIPIPFDLSISISDCFTVQVHQTTSRVGRAIVLLNVSQSSYRKKQTSPKLRLIDKWADSIQMSSLPKQDISTIDCKIRWLGFVDECESPQFPVPSLSIANAPFDNTVIPDFKMMVQGEEILTHKVILARYSPVLLAMFETPMKESIENEIIIDDIECSTMKSLLKVIYSGETDDLNDTDTALKVLQAAEKYQMSMVKHVCERKLQLKIQADNVLKFLEEADTHNAEELRESCIIYIIVRRDEEISAKLKALMRERPNIVSVIANTLMNNLNFLPLEVDL